MFKRRPIPFERSLTVINLTDAQRILLEERFVRILLELSTRISRISTMFHFARMIVTVGSLIVPALLSIQYMGSGGSTSIEVYWTTWVLSLLVSMCNGLVTLFKLDKKYYFLNTMMAQLESEGWQYLELSGKYSGFNTPLEPPTHQNQFTYFCAAVEKLRMKQITEEYFKLADKKDAPTKREEIMPPTPFRTQFSADQTKRLLEDIARESARDPEPNKSKQGVGNADQTDAARQKDGETESVSVFEDV